MRSFDIKVLNRRGKNNPNGSFDLRDALIDAGISAGLTFFTSLGGLTATGLMSRTGLIAAGIAAGFQFFAVLSAKWKVREKT